MHAIAMDPEVLDRVRSWRGDTHVFHDMDPAKTAHLVVDMQHAFTDVGAEMEVPTAREIIENINTVSRAVRAAGGVNIFTRMTVDANTDKNWSVWLGAFCDPERAGETRSLLEKGSHGWDLDDAIETTSSDVVIEKNRYSAFVPGASVLPTVLAERGIETIIVSGTVSNCCCESNARDAMQRNFNVIFLSDANAALSDSDHNATLNNMVSIFADVMDTREVSGFLSAKDPR